MTFNGQPYRQLPQITCQLCLTAEEHTLEDCTALSVEDFRALEVAA